MLLHCITNTWSVWINPHLLNKKNNFDGAMLFWLCGRIVVYLHTSQKPFSPNVMSGLVCDNSQRCVCSFVFSCCLRNPQFASVSNFTQLKKTEQRYRYLCQYSVWVSLKMRKYHSLKTQLLLGKFWADIHYIWYISNAKKRTEVNKPQNWFGWWIWRCLLWVRALWSVMYSLNVCQSLTSVWGM